MEVWNRWGKGEVPTAWLQRNFDLRSFRADGRFGDLVTGGKTLIVLYKLARKRLLQDTLPQPLCALDLALYGLHCFVSNGKQALCLVDDLALLFKWRERNGDATDFGEAERIKSRR